MQQRAANSADLITDFKRCRPRLHAPYVGPWLGLEPLLLCWQVRCEKPPTVRSVPQDLRMQLGLPLSLAPQMQFELLSSWLRTASMRVVTSFDTSLDVTDHSVLFKGKAHTYILLLKDGGKQGHSAEASYSVTGIKKSLRLKIYCVLSPAASGSCLWSLLGIWVRKQIPVNACRGRNLLILRTHIRSVPHSWLYRCVRVGKFFQLDPRGCLVSILLLVEMSYRYSA